MPNVARFMEQNIEEEECRAALSSMGAKKPPGWDGLTIEFIKEFWQEICKQIMTMTNNVFQAGMLKLGLMKGLFKPIPKQVNCSLQKH